MAAEHPIACPHCARTFATSEGLFCHVQAKHGRRAARAAVPDHPSVLRENARQAAARERQRREREREPSMAELAVEASLNRAMGLPVDPDIAEVFDV